MDFILKITERFMRSRIRIRIMLYLKSVFYCIGQ